MKNIIFFIFIIYFPFNTYSQISENIKEKICFTELGTIDDPDNDCHPCTNGMGKLLQPLLKLQQYKNRTKTVNQTLNNYLNSQQENINRLVDMQDEMTSDVRNWNINNLAGGFVSTDTDYIDDWIKELKKYKNRFGGDYDYINTMMDNWVKALESLKTMMGEDKQIDEKENEIERKIQSGYYGNLDSLNFDCCPDSDKIFDTTQLYKLDELLNDLDSILNEYFEYRSKMAEMTAHFTELLKNILLKRTAEEGEITENRDQYSDGLFAFLISEMVDGMKTAISQEINDKGINLLPEQQNAVNAFAEAAGPQIKSLISGGTIDISSAFVGEIIDKVGENMAPNDREALKSIGEQVWGEIAGRIVEKAASKLLEKAGTRFALQGIGSVVTFPITLWEQLITVPVYLWADRDLQVLKGAYDSIVISLLIAIKLSKNKSVYGPYSLINAYIDQLKAGRNKAISICLPEKSPSSSNADDYAQTFLKEVFGKGAPKSLSGNDHYDLIENEEGPNAKYLHYVYNNSLRIKVRFPCYCGKYMDKRVTTHYNKHIVDTTSFLRWEQIELTGVQSKLLKKKRRSPLWKPISVGAVAGGIIIGAIKLIPEKNPSPTPVLPKANSDQFTLNCGTDATINVTGNDTGEDISISSISPPSEINIVKVGNGNLYIQNTGSQSFNFSYTIVDQYGKTASTDVSIIIVDQQAPEISCQNTITINCNDNKDPEYTGYATATDNCSLNDQLSINYSDDLSGLTECNKTGTLIRTWSVTDLSGNIATCVQNIKIIDIKSPSINCPDDISISCEKETDPIITGNATAKDNCSTDENITIIYIDDESGLTECNKTGILIRSWYATDACGNNTKCIQKITIKDETTPQIICPPEKTIVAGESTNPDNTGLPEVSDNCTNPENIELFYKDDSSKIIDYSGVLLRIWRATDACDNEATCEQNIIIIPKDCVIDMKFETVSPDCGLSNGVISAVYDNNIDIKFQWSTGSEESKLIDLKSGLYTLTITAPEQHCVSEYKIQLDNKPVVYIKETEVYYYKCPQGGNIILNLDSPGEGSFYLNVFTDNTEYEFENIMKGKVSLNDLMFVDSGAYLITIYDVSLGDTCYQEIEIYVPAEEPYKLEITQLTNPTNTDKNNGSAAFLVNASEVTLPLAIYLDDAYYGQSWEPGFLIINLTTGYHHVYVIDANGCRSSNAIFTLYSDKTYKSSNSLTINNGLFEDIIFNNICENMIKELFNTQFFDEFPPGTIKKTIIIPYANISSPSVNYKHKNNLGNNYSTEMDFSIGQMSSALSFHVPDEKKNHIIPIKLTGNNISFTLNKSFGLRYFDLEFRANTTYTRMRLNPGFLRYFKLEHITDLLDSDLLTLNPELRIEKHIQKGFTLYLRSGIIIKDLSIHNALSYIFIDINHSVFNY